MNDDNLDLMWENAISCVRSGDTEGALFLFKALYRNGELASCREVGRIYERQGAYSKAREWYLKSIDEAEDVEGYIGCAKLSFYGWGEEISYSKALCLLQVVDANKNHKAYLLQGLIYQEKGDLNKAYYYLKSSYALGNIVALNKIAEIDKKRRRYISYIYKKILVIIKTFLIAMKDPHSEYIRQYI